MLNVMEKVSKQNDSEKYEFIAAKTLESCKVLLAPYHRTIRLSCDRELRSFIAASVKLISVLVLQTLTD